MKKLAVLLVVFMLVGLVSVAAAGEEKNGTLFLFQKCDESLKSVSGYDPSTGCPLPDTGPWPIFLNGAQGEMHYNLLGYKFRFSFEGKKLLPKKAYTLIYYPDPWPGNHLICLADGFTNDRGSIFMDGSMVITDLDEKPSGLPVNYDKNFNAVYPSGAVGAKIWLVLSDDVTCTGDITNPAKMLAWNPTAYLFEGNMIGYQRTANTPPVIKNVFAFPSKLWPPNHKMRSVTIGYTVKDDSTPPSDIVCTLAVTSNESISASDFEVVDAHRVKLRAERLGSETDRIYTITITCEDNEGLSSSKDVTVTVPHDMGKK